MAQVIGPSFVGHLIGRTKYISPAPTMRLAVALAVLIIGSAHGYLRKQPAEMDAHKCKVMCQRFGMKALAKKNQAFANIHNPTECCKVCDKVYTSLLQTSPVVVDHPVATASTAPVKNPNPPSAPVVKR